MECIDLASVGMQTQLYHCVQKVLAYTTSTYYERKQVWDGQEEKGGKNAPQFLHHCCICWEDRIM